MATITSKQSITIVDYNDALTLSGYINSNLPKTQQYNPDNGAYSPDWATGTTMILTPSLFKTGSAVDILKDATLKQSVLSIVWYEIVNGNTSQIITDGRYTIEDDGVMLITANVLSTVNVRDYICRIVYKDSSTQMELTHDLSLKLNKVVNGGGIADAICVTPDGTFFKNELVQSLRAQVNLWRGKEVDATNVAYEWYQQDSGITGNEGAGAGWRKLSDIQGVVTGTTSNEITIYPEGINQFAIFKAKVIDTDASSNTVNQAFYDTVEITDQSDPVSVTILSTGGTVFKNSSGSSVLTAKTFRAGTEIDVYGTMFTYTWKAYNADKQQVAFASGAMTKTGKTINIGDLDVTNLTEFEVTIETYSEITSSYGIVLDSRGAAVPVRSGNLALHKSLPIQSLMRGCLVSDAGVVNYYLNPNNWALKEDGSASKLDGTDGQVMVEIPSHYYIDRKLDDYRNDVRISLMPVAGYSFMPKCYVGAYEASLQRSTGKLSSVVNTSVDYRGGNNDAAWDGLSNTLLGRPVTSISLTDFRAYAQNRSSRGAANPYHVHKAVVWLYAIEYASLNAQQPVIGRNSAAEYMQGGLGNGVTTADGGKWGSYNGYNPFVPCGASNALGNFSGEVSYTAIDLDGAGVNKTFSVPRYRGIENPFGHVWKWTDGILIDQKSDAEGETSKLYTCDVPANYSSSSFVNYLLRGLLPRTSGWISQMQHGTNRDILPLATSGGSSTYSNDHYWTDVSTSGIRGVLFGGAASYGSSAGLVDVYTYYDPSYANTTIGSRLCFV